jgi:hypothetical protein
MTPKARKKEIESGRFEPVGRRVGAYEFDRGARRQPLGSARQFLEVQDANRTENSINEFVQAPRLPATSSG